MKKLSERSLKSKEKFADSNMAVANSITSAVFIGVLVFPLTAFVSAIILGKTPFISIKMPDFWHVLLFTALYFSPIIAAWYAKDKAMDLYDEVDSSTIQTETINKTHTLNNTKQSQVALNSEQY